MRLIYIINLPKRRRFGLGICYIYISLIGFVAFSCNTGAKNAKVVVFVTNIISFLKYLKHITVSQNVYEFL
jgi:hypothetical protein